MKKVCSLRSLSREAARTESLTELPTEIVTELLTELVKELLDVVGRSPPRSIEDESVGAARSHLQQEKRTSDEKLSVLSDEALLQKETSKSCCEGRRSRCCEGRRVVR